MTSYICTYCLHNINENKSPLYQILDIIFLIKKNSFGLKINTIFKKKIIIIGCLNSYKVHSTYDY
jgi:hypothetical protein